MSTYSPLPQALASKDFYVVLGTESQIQLQVSPYAEGTSFKCIAKSLNTGARREWEVTEAGNQSGYVTITIPETRREPLGYRYQLSLASSGAVLATGRVRVIDELFNDP